MYLLYLTHLLRRHLPVSWGQSVTRATLLAAGGVTLTVTVVPSPTPTTCPLVVMSVAFTFVTLLLATTPRCVGVFCPHAATAMQRAAANVRRVLAHCFIINLCLLPCFRRLNCCKFTHFYDKTKEKEINFSFLLKNLKQKSAETSCDRCLGGYFWFIILYT